MLDLLVQGERNVDGLARAAGLTLANASQHLLQLRRAGLVISRRDGKHVIYALSDPQVWQVVRAIRGVAERNLADVVGRKTPRGGEAKHALRRPAGRRSHWRGCEYRR